MAFITFEGMDGSGKTTQIEKLSSYLKKNGHDALVTKEPARINSVCDTLYKIIKENNESDSLSDLLMIYAIRYMHLRDIILKNIKGKIVICDRYIDSSIAYYSKGAKSNEEAIQTVLSLHNIVGEKAMPDITFLLDVSYDTSKERLQLRGVNKVDKFDNMSKVDFEKIRSSFIYNAVNFFSDRTFIIDANRSENEIFDDIISIMDYKQIY